MSRQTKSDWAKARSHVPWAEDDVWAERLAENPEALYRIIADSYDIALRDEEKLRGEQRSGRRPKPPQVPLDQVYAAVFPSQYSMDPFRETLEKLMDGRSQRAFARRVPCHQTTLSRLLSGALAPDLAMMERIASAAGVQPWYFVEWRAQFVASVVQSSLMANPNMSVNAIRGLRNMAGR